jgi:hypothetical protein
MSKSAKGKVDDLFATEFDLLRERKIYKIRAAMEALVFGAVMDSTTKRRQFQVLLNRAGQEVTTWSDADHQKAINRLEHDIHQVTPAQGKLFNILFQPHEQQLLKEVRTKATGPTSIFAKERTLRKTAAEDKAHGPAIMTAQMGLQFPNCRFDAETEAMTWSLSDPVVVTNQLEREIDGITSNEKMRCEKEISLCLIEFEPWCQTICIQVLWKTIE